MNDSPAPADKPASLREILDELVVNAGEEYMKLHTGKQDFTLTDGRMSYYENQAKAAINVYILAEVLALIPEGYEAPGLHRQELGEHEYYKQFYYNLALVHTKEAAIARFGKGETVTNGKGEVR